VSVWTSEGMGCFDIRPKFRGGLGIVMGRNGTKRPDSGHDSVECALTCLFASWATLISDYNEESQGFPTDTFTEQCWQGRWS
jgi:hypothetical protein